MIQMRAPTTAVIFQISCNGGDFSRDRGNTRYIPPTDSGVTASAGWMDLIISVTNARINSSTAPRPRARESAAVRCPVELETKAIRRFAKVSIVSYSRPSHMIIALGTQFYVYLLWGSSSSLPRPREAKKSKNFYR